MYIRRDINTISVGLHIMNMYNEKTTQVLKHSNYLPMDAEIRNTPVEYYVHQLKHRWHNPANNRPRWRSGYVIG